MLLLRYRGFSFLTTGDITSSRLLKIVQNLNIQVDGYKIEHHACGWEGNYLELRNIKILKPKFVIICKEMYERNEKNHHLYDNIASDTTIGRCYIIGSLG